MSVELSVIIPVKNIENEISGILRFLLSQAEKEKVEFIVVDMGSTDHTVIEAVQMIKEYHLQGCVIQNGSGTVSTALNTGIQKSVGKYLSFIFARRLYRDFLKSYYETAIKTDADFVFGCFTEIGVKQAERRTIQSSVVKRPSGADFLKDVLKGTQQIDISAVMIRREFLMENQLRFVEECMIGYAEEFIFRCLLYSPNAIQSPVLLKRESSFELRRGKQVCLGESVFTYVEAMLRVGRLIERQGNDEELKRIFFEDKLPKTMMESIDIMLREGNRVQDIREYVRRKGFGKYLAKAKVKDTELKKQIFLWRRAPWLYRAKGKIGVSATEKIGHFG